MSGTFGWAFSCIDDIGLSRESSLILRATRNGWSARAIFEAASDCWCDDEYVPRKSGYARARNRANLRVRAWMSALAWPTTFQG